MMAKLAHSGYYGWVYDAQYGHYAREYNLEEPEDISGFDLTMFPTVENFATRVNWIEHELDHQRYLVLVTDLDHNELYRDAENIQFLMLNQALFEQSFDQFLDREGVICKPQK